MNQYWLVGNDGQIISKSNSRLDFDDIGVGLLVTKAFSFVMENPINTDDVTFKISGTKLKLYDIDNDNNIIEIVSGEQTFIWADFVVNGSYGYCNIILGWESSEETSLDPDTDQLIVSANGNTLYTISANGDSIPLSDRHQVMLNNFRRSLTQEYLTAIKSTDLAQEVTDVIHINDKTREFLLNLFDLDVQIGSYDNIFKLLSFFEWDDFVRLKEYWISLKDNNVWKSTDITSQIADIFAFEDGYKKTRLLGLFYDLNTPDGTYDSDGFPYFIKVSLDFHVLMTKLNTLKRILQRDFLPDDVKIIDIVGEHTVFAGIDMNIFLNIAIFFENRLNENIEDLYIDIDIDSGPDGKIYLTEHKCLFNQNLYNISGDNVSSKGAPTHMQEKIFEIYAVDGELNDHTYGDFELLQNFYRGDFGLALINVTLKQPIPIIYYGYKIMIENLINTNSWDRSYLDETIRSVSDIEGLQRFGIKKTGTYRITFLFFDSFGSVSTVARKLQFEVLNTVLKIDLYRPKYILEDESTLTKINRTIQEIDTYKFESGTPVYDVSAFPTDENSVPYKFYADITRLGNTASPMFRDVDFNLIPSYKLNKIPVIEYSRFFEVLVWDVLGISDIQSGDEIFFKTRLFEGHDWDVITTTYGSLSDTELLQNFCGQLINYSEVFLDSAFANYTYAVVPVSLDGTMENNRPMIVMYSKTNDFEIGRHFFYETNIPLFGTNKIVPYGRVDATIRLDFADINDDISDVNDDALKFYIDGIKVLDEDCTTYQEVYNAILTYQTTHFRDVWIRKTDTTILISSSKHNIRLTHNTLGVYVDNIRNAHIEQFILGRIGDDVAIGSVLYAKIDEEEKYENSHFHWKVYDSFTNQMIHEDFNKMLRLAIMKQGIYDIEVEIIDESWINVSTLKVKKIGAFNVS